MSSKVRYRPYISWAPLFRFCIAIRSVSGVNLNAFSYHSIRRVNSVFSAAFVSLSLISISCLADYPYGPYKATFISAYDGDTMTLLLNLSPGLYRQTTVRLAAVDTPEIRGKCDTEKRQAIQARDLVREVLSQKAVTVVIHGIGKYGRWLATVYVDGHSLSATLLDRGLARPWTGRREEWCQTP